MAKKQQTSVPPIFCWTKMGTEAGQSLEQIIDRKELERKAGKGTFCWGIGNSLGINPKLAQDEVSNGEVDVLFTPMKSASKTIDETPQNLVIWLSYFNELGEHVDLPKHMLITSRGTGPSGQQKRTHYALFCSSNDEINSAENEGEFDASCVRNFVSLNSVGASQVTAVVRYNKARSNSLEKPYRIAFRAKFYQTGFVKLAAPVSINKELLPLLNSVCTSKNEIEWMKNLNKLKNMAKRSLENNTDQYELYGRLAAI